MQCEECGGEVWGDGYTSVLRCENYPEELMDDYEYAAPDEGPFCCPPNIGEEL